MKSLYVIRHGIADEAEDHGGDDERRQLTSKGAIRVRSVARYLLSAGIRFDITLTSPLVRAVETADIIGRHCSSGHRQTITDLLRPGGSYDELITYLNGLTEADSVAIVGHEPSLSGFVAYCLCGSDLPFVQMKKAGIALLRYDGPLTPGNCTLVWLMGPRQMSCPD